MAFFNNVLQSDTFELERQKINNLGLDVAALRNLAAVYSTTSGYTYLSNGIILQWGYQATTGNPPTNVAFPITFPTQCLAFIASNPLSPNSGDNAIGSATTNQFFQVGTYNGGWTQKPVVWVAIGY